MVVDLIMVIGSTTTSVDPTTLIHGGHRRRRPPVPMPSPPSRCILGTIGHRARQVGQCRKPTTPTAGGGPLYPRGRHWTRIGILGTPVIRSPVLNDDWLETSHCRLAVSMRPVGHIQHTPCAI